MIGAEAKNVLIGLVGAGGFAREVMPFAQMHIAKLAEKYAETNFEIAFVETSPVKNNVNGYKVVSESDFFEETADIRLFNIAIGNSTAREKISKRFLNKGCKPLRLCAPSSIVYNNNAIGEGAIICDNCMITANATIGKFFHANIYSYLAHDCQIGDFVTFAPRVSCNGNIKIENHAYIGAGAVIKQGKLGEPLIIGEGAIVGMGAVVTKHVLPYTTVVGNPARCLKKKA